MKLHELSVGMQVEVYCEGREGNAWHEPGKITHVPSYGDERPRVLIMPHSLRYRSAIGLGLDELCCLRLPPPEPQP